MTLEGSYKKVLIFGATKRFLYESGTTQKNASTLFENYHWFYYLQHCCIYKILLYLQIDKCYFKIMCFTAVIRLF